MEDRDGSRERERERERDRERERERERESGQSMLTVKHDDDDIYKYIHIYLCTQYLSKVFGHPKKIQFVSGKFYFQWNKMITTMFLFITINTNLPQWLWPLFHYSIIQSLCALVHWSLLVLFFFLRCRLKKWLKRVFLFFLYWAWL